MNYIGHYFIDYYKDDEYFVLGSILPDLYRKFSRVYNQKVKFIEAQNETSLIKGIKRHYAVDASFHNTLQFETICAEFESIFNESLLFYEHRVFFIAHILAEFLLDRYLIVKHQNLLPDFYSQLDKIEVKKLQKEINALVDNAASNRIFISNFGNFRESKFGYKIVHNESLIEALMYVLRLAQTPVLEIDQKNFIVQNMPRFELILQQYAETLIHQTKNNLNA